MQTKNRVIKNDDFLDAIRYYYDDLKTVENYSESIELRIDIPGMIDRVIFNDPATIILWNDGSKTVVKRSDDDVWDSEKGFCMAVIKKLYGNTSFIKRFIEPEEEIQILTVEEACENLKNFSKKLNDIICKGEKK